MNNQNKDLITLKQKKKMYTEQTLITGEKLFLEIRHFVQKLLPLLKTKTIPLNSAN